MGEEELNEADLDLIYNAAVQPELWTDVIKRLMVITRAESGALTRLDIEEGAGQALAAEGPPDLLREYFDYYYKINPMQLVEDPVGYTRGWAASILRDEDWMPREQLERSEYYNDFLNRCSGEWGLTIRLALKGSELATVSLGRSFQRGRFERPDMTQARRVQPHLIRSFALTQHMAALGGLSEDLATALERSGSPMLLLNGERRIVHLNGLAERMIAKGDVLRAEGGRLTAVDPSGTGLLEQAVVRAGARDWTQRNSGAIRLERPGNVLPLLITVAPLRLEAASVFVSGAAVLVSITDPADPGSARAAGRFDLSRAEQRLAAALVDGLSLKQMSDSFGVSINTTRTQLAHVFQKTGTHTQAELVRLLMSLR